MSRLLIPIFLCLSFNSVGQDSLGNFYSKNRVVIWKNNFHTTLSFKELTKEVKKSGVLSGIDTFDNIIVGQAIESAFDYKGAGYTSMSVNSGFMTGYTHKGAVTITYHDSAYFVEYSRILLVNQMSITTGLLRMEPGQITTFEVFALKKNGGFSTYALHKSVVKTMEYTFLKNFAFD
jgi:hypothetical protein